MRDPLVLLTAIAWALGVTASTTPCTAEPPGFREQLHELRRTARYAEARLVARRWEASLPQDGGGDHRLFDARNARRTLDRIVLLPDSLQAQLAAADRADDELERLRWGRDTVAPVVVSTRQYLVRRRILGSQHVETVASLTAVGTAYHRAGMYSRAEELLRQALRQRRRLLPEDHPDIAASLTALGVLLKDLGVSHHAEARRCQQEALSILQRATPTGDVRLAEPLQALGHLQRRAGKPVEAESLLIRALQLQRSVRGEDHPEVGNDLLWLGWFRMRNDRLEEAQNDFEHCQQIFETAGLDDKAREARNYLANVLVLRGDLDRAAALVLADWRASRKSLHRPALGLGRFAGNRGARAADLLLQADQPQAAWEVFAASSGWSARVYACLAERERQDGRLLDARRAVLDLAEATGSALPVPDVAFDDAQAMPRDSQQARGLDAAARWMASEQSAMMACAGDADDLGELRGIQAALQPHQAVIGWLMAEWSPFGGQRRDATWGYVIRRTGPVHWVHLATHTTRDQSRQWDQPRRQLHRFLQRASTWPTRVPIDAALIEGAREVAARWFDPLQIHLDGVEHLLVVLDDSNRLPPLDCLRDSQGVTLLERYVVSMLPSASAVGALSKRPPGSRPRREGRALIVGDPRFDPREEPGAGDDMQLAAQFSDDVQLVRNAVLSAPTLRSALDGDAATLRALPRLPSSRLEARQIAACFQEATVWVGSAPTERRVGQLLAASEGQGFDYVHLATHALLDLQAPERSAIVLSASDAALNAAARDDGLLTVREIYLGWKLDADLVTLSGCQTGQVSAVAGGYLGIAQAFLRAGVRSLLVSQWKVDDVATALLMGRFYENLTATGKTAATTSEPMSKALALSQAKRWLRELSDDEGRRPFEHPAYWAGFVLIGDPR